MTQNAPLTVRRASERGHANHGWLDSWHTFSFADYHDPAHMGFRTLRVINDDRVGGGGGFPMHPHRDMEIFSYLLEGQLEHKDSMGNSRVLRPEEIQLMRAGSGVMHSEFNPSREEMAHLLQIWITPNRRNLTPAYSEWTPVPDREPDVKTLVISEDGRNGSATIAQDASIFLVKPRTGSPARHELAPGRGLWLHVAKGKVTVNGLELAEGDAVSAESAGDFEIASVSDSPEAILFDLG